MRAGAVLRRGFGLAERVVPKAALPRLDAARLIAKSKADPSPAAREGLARLIAAIGKDSELSLFGSVSVPWDIVRLLRNAQAIETAHAEDPELGRRRIEKPIFILGLPRSGTTFLHTLLAEDAGNLVPRNWQTIYPAPRPPDFDAARDASARLVDRQLALFAGLAPGFTALHPVHADSPQECSEITSHVFQSLRFDTTFRVPDYLDWVERHGDLDAFRYHRKFLQVLQAASDARWVLKCPDHTFSLDAILRVYPDARFVVVHRDPIDVLGSVAYLTEVLRRPFLKNIDAAEIGVQVSERWVDGAARLVAFDKRDDLAGRKIHVHHDALIAQPIQAVETIYEYFGETLTAPARAAMTRQLEARPRGGYARHAPYSLKRFDVNPEKLRPRFAFYTDAYCT